MAHRRSSIKKIRIDERRRATNKRVLSELKTEARKFHAALTGKKFDEASKQSRIFFSKLDKSVKKGIVHRNKASRLKSRLSRRLLVLKPAAR